jgi:hypothetical protein
MGTSLLEQVPFKPAIERSLVPLDATFYRLTVLLWIGSKLGRIDGVALLRLGEERPKVLLGARSFPE